MLVLCRQRRHGTVALYPGIDELRHVGAVLDEGERRRPVIEVPAEATIIEIDDLGLVPIDQEIGEPHVAMDEAIALRALAEGVEPLLDEIDRALEEFRLFGIEPHAVAPRAPMLYLAEG